ncbi:MAG: ABC transporter permease [Romboutsia sp.]|nr:ABC transporter permease [Romboutsia sp.]
MKLRYAINGLKRNLIFTLLLIIQLVFAFYAIYNTIEVKNKVHTESDKIATYFKGKKVYKLNTQFTDNIFDQHSYPKVNEENLEKTFNELKNFSEINFTHQVLFPILIEKFDDNEDFKLYPPESEFEGKVFFQAKNITLNENTLKEFNIKLKDGRLFNSDEFEKSDGYNNKISIIVGANYGKYFKVGDEINHMSSDMGLIKAEIIGILEENQYIPMDMQAFNSNRYINLNNVILTGYSQFSSYEIMYDTMFGYNFLLFDENTSNERIEEVKNKTKEAFYNNLGIKVEIKDLNTYIKSELDTFKEQDNIISITSITIFIFISISLIISTLNAVYKRKKEFGIHIFSGGTIKDLATIIYLEILMILLFSLGITLLIIFYQYNIININNLKILFLVLIFISIITTILPVIKILKLGINNIIKGVE